MDLSNEAENYLIFWTFLLSEALERVQAEAPVAFLPSSYSFRSSIENMMSP